MKRTALLCLLALCVAGCAAPAGPISVELGGTGWSALQQGKGLLNIAVADERGGASPEQIGESRLDPQRAQPISTSSGDLRENLIRALERGMRSAGFDVAKVSVEGKRDAKSHRKALGALDQPGVLLVVNEWRVTLGNALAVRYDLSLHLIEPGRGEQASGEARGQKGFDPRGDSDPQTYTQDGVRKTLRHVLEALFAQPAIKGALPSAE